MRFLIGVDCDGLACVVGEGGKSLSFSGDYGFAREQATREADAAARALFDGGAERVVIWDNHGTGANLDFHGLDRRCEIALGAGFGRRWPGLDETFTAVLMIGYLVKDAVGTPQADDDASDLAFFSKDAFPEIAFDSHKRFIRIYFAAYAFQ